MKNKRLDTVKIKKKLYTFFLTIALHCKLIKPLYLQMEKIGKFSKQAFDNEQKNEHNT